VSDRPAVVRVPGQRERAVLAQVVLPDDPVAAVDALDELESLALAAGADVVGSLQQNRRLPDRATWLGAGRVEDLRALADDRTASLVVCGSDLTPAQGVNLEKRLGRRVVDRSQLIMDLFALRARTHQARLQVELAQLRYSLPRLKRMWTHLDRMKGGIGMRGPGETQLELDRREIEVKISDRRRRIASIEQAHALRREGRAGRFTVGLIGYTNAGKSTLFNTLARQRVEAEDRVFTTLDTKTSPWRVAPGLCVLLSDTVGFVRNLPHHLIASFHATLQEALEADLLLHVVDGARADSHLLIRAVEEVLAEVGAGDRPRRLVVNKLDAIPDRAMCARFGGDALLVSARSGEGIADLAAFVAGRAREADVTLTLRIPHADGAALAAIRARADVLRAESDESGTLVEARLPPDLAGRLRRYSVSL
jgi:GTP-binding protein HflX